MRQLAFEQARDARADGMRIEQHHARMVLAQPRDLRFDRRVIGIEVACAALRDVLGVRGLTWLVQILAPEGGGRAQLAGVLAGIDRARGRVEWVGRRARAQNRRAVPRASPHLCARARAAPAAPRCRTESRCRYAAWRRSAAPRHAAPAATQPSSPPTMRWCSGLKPMR